MKSRPILWIVLAELFGTSLWFSANSASESLKIEWAISQAEIGFLTMGVQAGFILGTLFFSLSGLADKFLASKIFAICCVLGAFFNGAFALISAGISSAIIFRFLVGITLAGIYPLGMKLIVGWDPKNAGKSLGILVGMLTLGTALPHGVRSIGQALPWQAVILASSALSLVGALIVWGLGDGPHLKTTTSKSGWNLKGVFKAFQLPNFRASAFGYFGHMWELYSFWTLVPMLLTLSFSEKGYGDINLSALAFWIIGIGAISCSIGGVWSQKIGSSKVAFYSLLLSGVICAIYPLLDGLGAYVHLGVLLLWGLVVIADSPQFSAISANACPPHLVGTALTIQNSIGFGLTIISILIATSAIDDVGSKVAWILLPGPVLGLFFTRLLITGNSTTKLR